MAESAENSVSKPKKPRLRSPNYPRISVEKAIGLVRKQHDSDGCQQIPVNIAHQRWGYAPLTGRAHLREAALKAYGLIDVLGLGKSRNIRVSERADRIIRQHPDCEIIIKEVALSPMIYREIWEHYEGNLPQDDVLQQFLVWEKGFNDKYVSKFISLFRETISFAKLEKGDILPIETGSRGGNGQPEQEDGPEPQTPNFFGEQMDNVVVTPQPASAATGTVGPKVLITRDFSIPRKAGRMAILRLEYPISSQDIDQIRSWLDLMGNTISEDEESGD